MGLMHAIHERIRQVLPITVSIGVGGTVELPENLRDSYLEAQEALKYKAVIGGDGVIPYPDKPGSDAQLYEHIQAIGLIVNSIGLTQPKWREELEALFAGIARDKLSRDQIGSLISYLLFRLDHTIGGMGSEYQNLWKADILPHLFQALKDEEMLEDLSSQVILLLESYITQVEALRESRSQRMLIQEVKQFIEEHYANAQMSLEWLSEKFGINGKYLSKLFKDEFGLKFVDFLIELRMNEAKRLLSETELSVQEIAEKVGYSSPISFSRSFKKVAGVPPADYRKR